MRIVKAFKFGENWHLGDNATLIRRQFLLPEETHTDYALIHVHEHEINDKLVIPEHVTVADLTTAAKIVRGGNILPNHITTLVDFEPQDLADHLDEHHLVRERKQN